MHRSLTALLASGLIASTASAVTFSTESVADTFVTAGSVASGAGNPNGNYGGAGAIQISGSATSKGAMDAFLRFDLTSVRNSFDGLYGAGGWTINGVTLQLGTNFGDQGEQPNNPIFNAINTGLFKIDWLTNDTWGGEGQGNPGSPFLPSNPPSDGVTWNSRTLLQGGSDENLGTFTYSPAGDTNPPTIQPATYALGLTSGFVSDVSAGNFVSFRGYAGDTTVGYLFNARSFASNHPTLIVSAVAVPEPATGLLIAGSVLMLSSRRRRHAHRA